MREATDIREPAGIRLDGSGDGRAGPSKERATIGIVSCAVALGACLGCEPELVVGSWDCALAAQGGAPGTGGAASTGGAPGDQAMPLPWTTSFEDGFCGYAAAGGFCYANSAASYEVVSSPVHSGTSAAAYRVRGNPDGLQARCAQQGILPLAAYYGAWFYVPEVVTSTDNWNLFHFDGDTADVAHGLWDVSLGVGANGGLYAFVYDFLHATLWQATGPAAVPVGAWFHLEVYLVRAADATGRFELYVDGELALTLANWATSDSEIVQWYVGSLAKSITPQPNTLYVDDVTIALERQGAP